MSIFERLRAWWQAPVLARLDAIEQAFRDRENVLTVQVQILTWRLAALAAHVCGGTVEEWKKPLPRGPRVFDRERRQ